MGLLVSVPAYKKLGSHHSVLTSKKAERTEKSAAIICNLMREIISKREIIRQFCHCMNIIECTCTHLDGTYIQLTTHAPRLYGMAYCC